MLELLKFEYYRLLKCKVIWVMAALAALAPLLVAIVIRLLLVNLGDIEIDDLNLTHSNVRFLNWYVISYFYERIPLAIALFTPLFVGRDYKDGFIRNKITAGHTRIEIFSAVVITEVSLTVALSLIYIIFGLIGMACTGFGVDLNHGEMLGRAATMLLSLVATSVLFAVISLLIKSRAGTTVICIAFIFSLGLFSMLSTNFSYTHKMIDEYEDIYNDAVEDYFGGFDGNSMYYGDDDAEFDKDSYFNAGWYIGHPIFVLTNASLGDEFVANFSNIFMAGDIEDLFSYPDKIARTSFVSSYMTLLSGNNMGYFISQDDIEDIEGAFVDYEVAELQYNLKSVLWAAVYFCGGYALFRKKNIF